MSSGGILVTRMRPRIHAAFFWVATLSTSVAFADPQADARLAQALFDEGRALMAQKRWAEACPKLAESQRLDPGGGTLLNLALCHAGEGKTATALVELHDALAAAVRDGRADREKLARESILSLESEVPKITVDVPSSTRLDGLEVKLDDMNLAPAAWGVAAPVDPGAHVVRATVPGRQPWTAVVSVAAGERKSISVPPLATEAPPPDAVGGLVLPVPTAPAEAPPGPRGSRANPIFWGALAVTTASALTGIVAGVMALDADATAEKGCIADRNFCRTQEGRDAAESLPTLAWISTGAFVIAAIGGITALAVPTRKDSHVSISPFGVRGTF
jgi:serine/threonine-protein kinase